MGKWVCDAIRAETNRNCPCSAVLEVLSLMFKPEESALRFSDLTEICVL